MHTTVSNRFSGGESSARVAGSTSGDDPACSPKEVKQLLNRSVLVFVRESHDCALPPGGLRGFRSPRF